MMAAGEARPSRHRAQIRERPLSVSAYFSARASVPFSSVRCSQLAHEKCCRYDDYGRGGGGFGDRRGREGDRYDRGPRSYENEDGERIEIVSQADTVSSWRGGGGGGSSFGGDRGGDRGGYGDRGGDRFGGGGGFGDRGGDRFGGGDRGGYGDRDGYGDRGGDRGGYGDRGGERGERYERPAGFNPRGLNVPSDPPPAEGQERGGGGGGGGGGDRFGGDRGGDRFGGDRGGDRFGGDRGGFGGDRGGDRGGFGGDRGGDRYGGREDNRQQQPERELVRGANFVPRDAGGGGDRDRGGFGDRGGERYERSGTFNPRGLNAEREGGGGGGGGGGPPPSGERRKLQLAPRTVGQKKEDAPAEASNKPNPFGGARPVDKPAEPPPEKEMEALAVDDAAGGA
eukprot:Transcript_5431.p1 GENE.Transcript_5431~~Transcript_5431.p1  ORF type:complete len:397 (+),score=82.12 Transcript_5431:185-1375(+)